MPGSTMRFLFKHAAIVAAVTLSVASMPPDVKLIRLGMLIDFGFNGTDLTQVGATPNALQQGNCVNGLGQSLFTQVAFCNSPAASPTRWLFAEEWEEKCPRMNSAWR